MALDLLLDSFLDWNHFRIVGILDLICLGHMHLWLSAQASFILEGAPLILKVTYDLLYWLHLEFFLKVWESPKSFHAFIKLAVTSVLSLLCLKIILQLFIQFLLFSELVQVFKHKLWLLSTARHIVTYIVVFVVLIAILIMMGGSSTICTISLVSLIEMLLAFVNFPLIPRIFEGG